MIKRPRAKKPAAIHLPPELRRLEEVVGKFIEYWGFKKIHGRIWAHLYTSQRALDSIELMRRLRVSKGLMSIALRDLIEHKVVEVAHIGRHGTSFYSANPDLVGVITNVLRTREAVMLGSAKHAAGRLARLKVTEMQAAGIDKERVQNILMLIGSAQDLANAFVISDPGPTAAIFTPMLAPGN